MIENHMVIPGADDPANAPDDNGKRYCRQCCETVDLLEGDKKDEYHRCYEHEADHAELRAACAEKEKQVGLVSKAYREHVEASIKREAESRQKIAELESRLAYLRGGFDEIAKIASECLERNG